MTMTPTIRLFVISLLVLAGCSNAEATYKSDGPVATTSDAVTAPATLILAPTNGVQGTMVTITGASLTTTSGVTFGGVATSFIVVSDTQLGVVVPSGAANAAATPTGKSAAPPGCPVVVTRRSGGQSIGKFDILPTIASFSPAGARSGATITILGSGLAHAFRVMIAGADAVSFVVVSDGEITANVPAARGAVASPIAVHTPYGAATTPTAFTINPGQPPSPTVVLAPTNGVQGATVTITGASLTNAWAVTFGGVATSFIVLSDTELSVVVPSGAANAAAIPAGKSAAPPGCPVVVTRRSGGQSIGKFDILPSIASFSPTGAGSGATVTILGSGFAHALGVKVAGAKAASFVVISDGEITANVPAARGAIAGPIEVQTPYGAATTPTAFTINPGQPPSPAVILAPANGVQGATVAITGASLTSTLGVTFGGVATSFIVVSDTELSVVVPSGAANAAATPAGKSAAPPGCPVVVTRRSGEESIGKFDILPSIASFSATGAGSGATITILGSGLAHALRVVIAGTDATSFVVVSDAEITANVPAARGAVAGPIGVQTPYGTATTPTAFTINPGRPPSPTIGAIAPQAGPPGTVVTVSGLGFAGVSGVLFGGVPASSFAVASYTSLAAVVPAGAVTGPVTVTTAAGGGVSSAAFAVCNVGSNACSGVCVDLLSDLNNCGGCGINCGGSCSAGRCLVTLASGQLSPSDIAVDAASVYWTNTIGGTVARVPIGGGAITALASGQDYPWAIAVDGTSVYWTNIANSVAGAGSVMKVPLSGGLVATLASGQNNNRHLAVDSTSVYWTNYSDVGSVMKVPLGGGAPTTLASGLFYPAGIAVDAATVYWTNFGAGTVMDVPLGGGTPTLLATGQDHPWGIAVDATSAYWTDNNNPAPVLTAPLGGGTLTTLASGQDYPVGIAIDATSIYWTVYSNPGTVMKVALGGGMPITLASGLNYPIAIAVDATSVYWTTQGDGSVMRVTPKF